MKTQAILLFIAVFFSTITLKAQVEGKLVSTKTHVKFFSSTAAEDIEANNYSSVSTLNTETGEGIFSVPMQSFEFEKALMQKHYNSKKFLDTKAFPKAKLKGKIINIKEIDFSTPGKYSANITGEMTIKGTTNSFEAPTTITVKENQLWVNSTFPITLSDYGVEFLKGKPASNIAKTVEVTVVGEFETKD